MACQAFGTGAEALGPAYRVRTWRESHTTDAPRCIARSDFARSLRLRRPKREKPPLLSKDPVKTRVAKHKRVEIADMMPSQPGATSTSAFAWYSPATITSFAGDGNAFQKRELVVEAIPQLPVHLPRIIEVKPAEGQAVIDQKVCIGEV